MQRAHAFWKHGILRDVVRPPWTPGLVDLLLFYDRLEKVREAELAAESERRGREDAERMFNR
jgi:hypothetical protein